MIIVRIMGGLGNQMFQYAAGRALSLRHKVPLRLDATEYARTIAHQGFELQHVFSAPAPLAEPTDLNRALGWQSHRLALRLIARPAARLIRDNRLIVEPHFHYFEGIKQAPATCYLKGYWQSERYFSCVADQIREDFTFREKLSEDNSRLAEIIGSVHAVSLHVRRGDYVRNPHTLSVHGVCPLEYYESAIRLMNERVSEPVFFVFSDDLNWAKDSLKIDGPAFFVDQNRGKDSFNDMRLMSMCAHHIIANSSFSWWGAWLNPSPSKVVIAPKRWFAKPVNTADLLPEGWIRL